MRPAANPRESERAAKGVIASWNDETLAGDIPALSDRLFRATGADPVLAAKLIRAEQFNRRRA